MEKPKNCQNCVFGVCRYSLPLSLHKKGYSCLLNNGQTEEFNYDAEVHLKNCPLREVPQKEDKDRTRYDTDYNYALGYNDCIDEILKGNEYENM